LTIRIRTNNEHNVAARTLPDGRDEDETVEVRVMHLLLDGLPLEMARFYGDALR
jgi:hypothetical protein